MASQRQTLPERYWSENKIVAVLIQLFPSNMPEYQDFYNKQKRILRTQDPRRVFDICVSQALGEFLKY
jgi:hypothetical protein